MKRTWLAFGLAALAVCGSASRARAARTFGDGGLPSLLGIYDLDANGVLSEEERQAMNDARGARRGELLRQWDSDGDGSLSAPECELARETLRNHRETRRQERFNEADTGGDGFLSPAEFSAIPAVAELAAADPSAPARIFGGLDRNGDGRVSAQEFLGHLTEGHRPSLEAIFASADADTDGTLTYAEFVTLPEMARLLQEHPDEPPEYFDRLDANRDTLLTLTEFLAQRPHEDGPTVAEQFALADADHSGFLSATEFGTVPSVAELARLHPEAPAQIFAALDENHDGVISPAEFLNLPGYLLSDEHDGGGDQPGAPQSPDKGGRPRP